MGTRGTIQAPPFVEWVGNCQVPVQRHYLHSGRIQISGVYLCSLCYHPFPMAKHSDELLLRMGQHRSHIPSTGYPPSAVQGRASAMADTDPTPSAASAEPAPHFVHRQAWVSPGWQCGKPKQCHEHCKTSRNTGAGHELPSKAHFCSSNWVFHAKPEKAVPPGCRHHTLLCSLGAIQLTRAAWREKHRC